MEDEFIRYLKLKIEFNKKRKERGIFISYHKFNEDLRIEKFVKILRYGINITLVSDAGVPCISDPGFKLVKRCYEEGLEVESLPGGSSVTLALSLCGFPADSFFFIGFISKGQQEREEKLEQARRLRKTAVIFESLQRIGTTLLSIEKIYGSNQQIWIGGELTKLYEKKRRGSVRDLYELVAENEREKKMWKGELVLIIGPHSRDYNIDLDNEVSEES